jgi:hypothetical protein
MNEEIRDGLNISLPEWPISVAGRSKARVCGRSLARIVGSNPAGGNGYLSVVRIVCCQVDVSMSDRSHVKRSSTECDMCVCVSMIVNRCNITFYTYEYVEEVRIRQTDRQTHRHTDRHAECMLAVKILLNPDQYILHTSLCSIYLFIYLFVLY